MATMVGVKSAGCNGNSARFDSVADFLLEVRHRFHPGKPVEICLGKAFLGVDLASGESQTAFLVLNDQLEALNVRADLAREMVDFLLSSIERGEQ